MSNRARSLACALLIVLVGVLTYANSLSGPLIADDNSAIVRNPQIRRLWPLVEALAAPRDNELASRPLVNLSFAVNYAIGALSVRGYHIVNLGLHVLSALLLFGIVRRTMRTGALRQRFAGTANGIALASALIWMVHPLLTESIDYVTQRTELMMGLFYFLTLYCAIRAAEPGNAGGWRSAAIFSCLLGMGSKETMATVPVIVVLYDRIFLFDSGREAWRCRKGLYAGLALGWLALAALLLSSLPPTIGFGSRVSGWTYLLNQCPMILRYLGLAVWPSGLVFDYGLPHPMVLTDVLPQATLVAALAALTVVALFVRPMIGFLGAWFFITLAPTSSVMPIITEVGAERRMYLPLAALVVLTVIAADRLCAVAGRRRVAVAVTAAVVIVVALALATARRNHEYAFATSLLQTSVDRRPHGRAHLVLAGALLDEGRNNEAMAHMRAAIPDYPRALLVLGSALYNRGQFDDAITELRAFIARVDGRPEWVPLSVTARTLTALSRVRQGKLPQAVEEFQSALQLDAEDPEVHANLALVLLLQSDFEGARQHYEKFLERRQGSAVVLTNLGVALQKLGHPDEAKARFRQALTIDPNYRDARRGLDGLSEAMTPPPR